MSTICSCVRSLDLIDDRQPPTTGDTQFSILNSQFHARFDSTQADLAWANGWLATQGIGVGDQLVVLHPGTAGPAKLWRAERWAAVAEALMGPGTRLLLTGGPGEEGLVEEVATRMRIRPPRWLGRRPSGSSRRCYGARR
jgi:ADP-heptose:LPS heptosyltransferase